MTVKLRVLSTCFQFSEINSPILSSMVEFQHRPAKTQKHDPLSMSKLLSQADIAIVGDDPVGPTELGASESLKLIIRWGAGTDNVDLVACKELGIKVENTPGLFGRDVADLALAMALDLVRGVSRNDRSIRRGQWPKDTSHSFRSLSACILGLGAVGQELARILLSLGLEVRGFDLNPDAGKSLGITLATSHLEAVTAANLCFLALPLTPETRELVDRNFLARLARPSYLINVSRGELVKESEMLSLLSDGTLTGAALDVFESEPLSTDAPHSSVENLLMSAHNASNTFSSIGAANKRTEQIIGKYLGIETF